jgi:transcriptional regulator with XRE-family HTH domain
MTDENQLGTYLRDRRARLDPAAFGFPLTRRRTPGLRREEVAQRANVSATWYTWLEQGRGGAPSADVLDRIARAMMLADVEREHLFLLGLGRPPEARYHAPDGITPRLQRLLDTLAYSPAFIRTATWDVIAWNKAAAVVLTDYSTLPAGERNVLRMVFRDSRVRVRREMSSRWSMSYAQQVPNLRRCGVRTMYKARACKDLACKDLARKDLAGKDLATASKSCTIPSQDRSRWNSRSLPWTGGAISP